VTAREPVRPPPHRSGGDGGSLRRAGDRRPEGPRVVALGGGHGLAASLSALARVTERLTAVVTVADDGGSSGRLRSELSVLPPGDLRMALAALAGGRPSEATWAALLQHRFAGEGPLGGHAVGNLLLAGLTDVLGDPVAALEVVAQVVGARGRVLPASRVPLDIEAEVVGLDAGAPARVRGQVAVATTPGHVVSVRLLPESPPATPEAVTALGEADWVVLGPGSWFSSVLPHLLVPGLAEALLRGRARTAVTLNLAPQPGETDGFSPEAHLEVLVAHSPSLRVDVVVADRHAVGDARGLMRVAESLGARVALADVATPDGRPTHDPGRLAGVYAQVMGCGLLAGKG
jgi:uncharacterized cofD-like protein